MGCDKASKLTEALPDQAFTGSRSHCADQKCPDPSGSAHPFCCTAEGVAEANAAAGSSEKYDAFWGQYGKAIKLGVIEDGGNRQRLARLLRFHTSKFPDTWTSLEDYVSRMQEDQKQIYYLAGEHPRQCVTRLWKLPGRPEAIHYLCGSLRQKACAKYHTGPQVARAAPASPCQIAKASSNAGGFVRGCHTLILDMMIRCRVEAKFELCDFGALRLVLFLPQCPSASFAKKAYISRCSKCKSNVGDWLHSRLTAKFDFGNMLRHHPDEIWQY